MFAYRHLVSPPVFERERLWYLRLSDTRSVVLRHGDGNPIAGFVGAWQPKFVYTGLECIHFLDFEENGARATWLVAPDGRRLGDKLADLQPQELAELREAIISSGLAKPAGLAGDGIQFIEADLLADLLRLADKPRGGASAATSTLLTSQATLAMLRAPRGLNTLLQFKPGDRTLLLRQGWSEEQPNSCRAVGTLSAIETGLLPLAARHFLAMTLTPLAGTQAADLEIVVNDRVVARTRLDPDWQQEGADLAFWLAPELVGGRPLHISFRHSQDFMLAGLKLSSESRTQQTETLSPEQLMLRFENLGDNCEFGLVQRHFGADPVGLLRFAGLRNPRRLIRFLEDDFGRLGEPGSLGVSIVGSEYWIVDHVYGFASHTFRHQHEANAEEVIRENEIKAGYLKRKFREDLEDGEKILVYKRVVTQDPAEMLALHAALNRFGTTNKLLWVTQADSQHTPGDVEWIGDRLLKGYVDAISLSNANDYNPSTWLLLCRNALAAFGAAS